MVNHAPQVKIIVLLALYRYSVCTTGLMDAGTSLGTEPFLGAKRRETMSGYSHLPLRSSAYNTLGNTKRQICVELRGIERIEN